ncbi:hypothetical protein BZA70DRAFT_171314 [Myxozyma melibiosi]|uniref:Secreted protein n=1 Tax=Myxozyma melibiosi TaxID=54550 RepID=A0ABR1F7L7_9ASCO
MLLFCSRMSFGSGSVGTTKDPQLFSLTSLCVFFCSYTVWTEPGPGWKAVYFCSGDGKASTSGKLDCPRRCYPPAATATRRTISNTCSILYPFSSLISHNDQDRPARDNSKKDHVATVISISLLVPKSPTINTNTSESRNKPLIRVGNHISTLSPLPSFSHSIFPAQSLHRRAQVVPCMTFVR